VGARRHTSPGTESPRRDKHADAASAQTNCPRSGNFRR
jgi:hypothetical protein